MPTTLIKNSHTLVTMDPQRREIPHGSVLIRDQVIEQVGVFEDPDDVDDVLDLKGEHLVLPGLINTHHHFVQTLTRVVPKAQDSTLFGWLQTLYPIWANLTPEHIKIGSQMAAAELMLSGCTTSSDHLYIYPNGSKLDDQIAGIQEIGLRFHACRGSMSVGESLGGLPPHQVVEKEEDILVDSQRLIEQYHDMGHHAMLRIVLAPCSPFSVTPDLMKQSATLARSYEGVRLHTHLAENDSDVDYSLEMFGMTPTQYADSVNWLGPDVWHAHCVKLSPEAVQMFAKTKTGVSHCPGSNMRLGSGIAPIRSMLESGVPVSLGVDGASSNDATHILAEARLAFLLARVRDQSAAALTARQVLEMATLGGADVLGRDDVGALAPGMSADLIAIDVNRPALVGTWQDPVAALVFCQVDRVDYSFINGRKVVNQGYLTTLDLDHLMKQTNHLSRRLWD